VGSTTVSGATSRAVTTIWAATASDWRSWKSANATWTPKKVSSTVIRHLVAQGDMARAARLLSHPYLVIGTAAAGRIRTDDPLKLLPPAGSYQVRIGGRPARLTVDASQNLIIRDGCPDRDGRPSR